MFVFHERFDNADRHAEALRGWNQRYDQIGSGAYRSAVKHAVLDSVQLFQEAANVRIIQRGRLPHDQTVFGMPLTGAGAFAFGGARIERGTMVLARGGTPFELHSPDDMSLIGVVANGELLQQIEDAADVRLDEVTLRRGVVDMPTAVLMRASVQIATHLERVLSAPIPSATNARSANCAARSATCSSISSRTGFPSRRTVSRMHAAPTSCAACTTT